MERALFLCCLIFIAQQAHILFLLGLHHVLTHQPAITYLRLVQLRRQHVQLEHTLQLLQLLQHLHVFKHQLAIMQLVLAQLRRQHV
jgi:hypothetical protein